MPSSRLAQLQFPHRFRRPVRLLVRPTVLLAGLFAVALSACGGGGEPTGPGPAASAIRVQTGNTQTGTVGTALSTQLSVIVSDASGKNVPGARVEWDASAGSGTLNPTSTTTDSRGVATTTWTLGTVAGTARVTAQTSGVTPVSFTATALPGAAAAVVATPELANLGVGDTIRVRAGVRDQYGNDVTGQTVTFSTLDPAIATVAATGLVSAVSIGNARIVAAAGTRADTVPITVNVAGSGVCGATTPRTLALGEAYIPPASASSVSACLAAPSNVNAEYALAMISTSPSYATVTPLDVYGIGNTGPATAALQAFEPGDVPIGTPPNAITLAYETARSASPVAAAEFARRESARGELAGLVPSARAWQSMRASTPSLQQLVEARVGDIVRLNANPNVGCSSADTRTSRIAAVGNRAIVVADTGNPSGGYTDAEYASILATFDTLVYPIDTTAFGAPSNISQYGKVVLFYTRNVNALTPPNANYTVGGFFYSRDLYPRTPRNGLLGCEASNEQEMLYLLVPDPSGLVNNNKRTKDEITLLNLGTITHELQHLINASRRLYVTPNAVPVEETWLDEGLSHIAEELLFFRISGFTTRQNLTLLDVSRQGANFTNYASQNFSRFYNFLVSPEISSPYAPNDSLSTRGATWNFLRFTAGRQGASGEAPFFHALVNSPTTGFANLNNATGGQIGDYLRDWAVSNIADDVSSAETAALDPRYILPAWNFRNIFPGLRFSGGAALGVYPIAARSLTNNSTQRITLAGGTSSYVRFGIQSGRSALLTLSSNGGAVPGAVRYTLVRVR